MTRTNGGKTEPAVQDLPPLAEPVVDLKTKDIKGTAPEPLADMQDIDESVNALKTLLNAVEKLQKVRQEVGDIKPLLMRMLDGEVVSGDELEQLKIGVGGLLRLVRAYSDHQTALGKAQPARDLLDQVMKSPKSTR